MEAGEAQLAATLDGGAAAMAMLCLEATDSLRWDEAEPSALEPPGLGRELGTGSGQAERAAGEARTRWGGAVAGTAQPAALRWGASAGTASLWPEGAVWVPLWTGFRLATRALPETARGGSNRGIVAVTPSRKLLDTPRRSSPASLPSATAELGRAGRCVWSAWSGCSPAGLASVGAATRTRGPPAKPVRRMSKLCERPQARDALPLLSGLAAAPPTPSGGPTVPASTAEASPASGEAEAEAEADTPLTPAPAACAKT